MQVEYKMNIVSNTCIGAYITRDIIKEQYQNPFQWNIIDYDSLKLLIENWYSIKSFDIQATIQKGHDYPTVILNNVIKIEYLHIKLKSKRSSENRNDIFIDDDKIIDYTISKFKERLRRLNDEPLFIIQNQPHHNITGNKNNLINFYNTVKTHFPIIILTDDKSIVSKNNILVFHVKTGLDAPQNMAKLVGQLLKKYSTKFS